MSASPHAQRLPPHPLLLGLVACTLLLVSVGVVVWWQDAPPVAQAVPVTPRPSADLATPEPEPPSALWDAEKMERALLQPILKGLPRRAHRGEPGA